MHSLGQEKRGVESWAWEDRIGNAHVVASFILKGRDCNGVKAPTWNHSVASILRWYATGHPADSRHKCIQENSRRDLCSEGSASYNKILCINLLIIQLCIVENCVCFDVSDYLQLILQHDRESWISPGCCKKQIFFEFGQERTGWGLHSPVAVSWSLIVLEILFNKDAHSWSF